MGKKMTGFKTKGMNKDLSVSAFNPEFAFENKNLRLSTNEGNTLLSWVNEKGTEAIGTYKAEHWEKTGYADVYVEPSPTTGWTHYNAGVRSIDIYGTPIGTAVINNTLVLFTTGISGDAIYKLQYNADKSKLIVTPLYLGDLSFSDDAPIETLVSYEAENIQKVYWVDGKNQPRVINICADVTSKPATYFDFVPELQLKEEVKVQKMLWTSGMFAPGVIQYSFTYFNKNGQESNIFYTTPLYYISHKDRGASPEDKVGNAFRITIEKVDTNFDYLRIYSIQRTSINGTPIVKRIQDIAISGLINIGTEQNPNYRATYTDTGTNGDAVDPTELLYKGGESIVVKTMEQKDNTLFFGNIKLARLQKPINSFASGEGVTLDIGDRAFYTQQPSSSSYTYANQLTVYKDDDLTESVPCAGFKGGNYYRCGIQFQHKTGKWSDPLYIDDFPLVNSDYVISSRVDSNDNSKIHVPVISGSLSIKLVTWNALKDKGYRKVRAVVVFPQIQDRSVVCQGVANCTVYTPKQRSSNDLYAQSSWFFRTNVYNTVANNGSVAPRMAIEYTSNNMSAEHSYNPNKPNIRNVEIQGQFNDDSTPGTGTKFLIDDYFVTFHSPEIEFDDQFYNLPLKGLDAAQIGYCEFVNTLSDIGIQTETPTIGDSCLGFDHTSTIYNNDASFGIISGLFYEDYIVDDYNQDFEKYRYERVAARWLVYPWQKQGSLNNDVERPGGRGTASAILKKKVISNLRYAETSFNGQVLHSYTPADIQSFYTEEAQVIKVDNNVYMGNIDTLLIPDDEEGMYFAFYNDGINGDSYTRTTPFTSNWWWKTYWKGNDNRGAYKFNDNSDEWPQNPTESDFGDDYKSLLLKKDPVRMKYKSSPHLVLSYTYPNKPTWDAHKLPIIELTRDVDTDLIFGGNSTDALKSNIWIPCGEPVDLNNAITSGSNKVLSFEYSYGDTYFQRWDCLKTYAYTKEDINQVVEIGSFMLETHVNIDGRYDRNRGQQSNLNMSPENFNLLNPVYSQIDNFFSYKILDDSAYENNKFPNQITWSKAKENGADVDLWTNVTLASILELDGDKGEITSLQRFNNNLIAFQDTGISRIMYNDNVQIQSTDGVPIEIANSGKVQGKDYLSDTVGCSNKWSIVSTPAGLYFADNKGKNLYLFNGQLTNISDKLGMSSWVKNNFFGGGEWTPGFDSNNDIVAYYDRQNQDVLFINKYDCLAFSEKIGAFTSLYNYENTPYFVNLEDTGVWIRNHYTTGSVGSEVTHPAALWKHQAGDYCRFFGENKPYWMTLVGNPEPQLDKIFTNLEFRACVSGDGTYDDATNKFTPDLPFDSLETWDEYQHGLTPLENKNGHSAMVHGSDTSALKRKFRIWRCDIPRDNVRIVTEPPVLPVNPTPEQQAAYNAEVVKYNQYLEDTNNGIFRIASRPMDRMRNPWLYLKLKKNAMTGTHTEGGQTVPNVLPKAEIHDIVMTYFG